MAQSFLHFESGHLCHVKRGIVYNLINVANNKCKKKHDLISEVHYTWLGTEWVFLWLFYPLACFNYLIIQVN